MNQPSLQKLIELVEFDQKTVQLEQQLEALQAKLDAANKEALVCKEGLEKFVELKSSTKKEVDAKELEMETLNQAEKEKRKKLDGSMNQREYNSFLKEIEALQKQQHELEDQLLASWKKYEQTESELKNRESFCNEKLISLDTIIAEKMKHVAELKAEITKQKELREEKLKEISTELLEKYASMYKQVSNPVVHIYKNSCSACFYPLTQQDVHSARNGKLIQCKDCFRFLFLKEAHESLEQQ